MPISSETVSSAYLASLGPRAQHDFLTQRFAGSAARSDADLQRRLAKTRGKLMPASSHGSTTCRVVDLKSPFDATAPAVTTSTTATSTFAPSSDAWHAPLRLRNRLLKPHHDGLLSLLDKHKRDLLEHSAEFKQDARLLRQQCMDWGSELETLRYQESMLLKSLADDEAQLAWLEEKLRLSDQTGSGVYRPMQRRCIQLHKKGVAILEESFGYHPIFKRPDDTFAARSTYCPPRLPKDHMAP